MIGGVGVGTCVVTGVVDMGFVEAAGVETGGAMVGVVGVIGALPFL